MAQADKRKRPGSNASGPVSLTVLEMVSGSDRDAQDDRRRGGPAGPATTAARHRGPRAHRSVQCSERRHDCQILSPSRGLTTAQPDATVGVWGRCNNCEGQAESPLTSVLVPCAGYLTHSGISAAAFSDSRTRPAVPSIAIHTSPSFESSGPCGNRPKWGTKPSPTPRALRRYTATSGGSTMAHGVSVCRMVSLGNCDASHHACGGAARAPGVHAVFTKRSPHERVQRRRQRRQTRRWGRQT